MNPLLWLSSRWRSVGSFLRSSDSLSATLWLSIPMALASVSVSAQPQVSALGAPDSSKTESLTESVQVAVGSGDVLLWQRAMESGAVVFAVLVILVAMSILTWAVMVTKWVQLTRLEKGNKDFIRVFWDSRSLNDLNGRLGEYGYSPVKEVFRTGYSELVRSSPLREQCSSLSTAVSAAMDNLHRSLHKAKAVEKKSLDRFLTLLALTASSGPFIGLFGTVWGIMSAFEGIAQTGSASLATVAPGISEALIATAFGLAAAIPAVIGYNVAQNKIRTQLVQIDGFIADFMNIIERYLVSDRKGAQTTQQPPL